MRKKPDLKYSSEYVCQPLNFAVRELENPGTRTSELLTVVLNVFHFFRNHYQEPVE